MSRKPGRIIRSVKSGSRRLARGVFGFSRSRGIEEISRPIASYVPLSWYAHAFVYVVPENGETLPYVNSNNASINTSQPFTLGAYPNSQLPPHLTYSADNAKDYSIASVNMSVPGVSRQIVSPPPGMTSAQFGARVVSNFNDLSPDQGIYDPFGWRRSTGLSNSNNANTSLLMNSGVSQQQMNGIKTSLYATPFLCAEHRMDPACDDPAGRTFALACRRHAVAAGRSIKAGSRCRGIDSRTACHRIPSAVSPVLHQDVGADPAVRPIRRV